MARTSPLFLRVTLTSALAFAMAIAVMRAEVHPATPQAPVHFKALAAAAALDQRQSGRADRADGHRTSDPTVRPATRMTAPRSPAVTDLGAAQQVWHQIWASMLRASRESW